MRDPAQDPERRHQSRAWRLMEAMESAPFGNEARLAIAQKFLDEQSKETQAELEHDMCRAIEYPCPPECPRH